MLRRCLTLPYALSLTHSEPVKTDIRPTPAIFFPELQAALFVVKLCTQHLSSRRASYFFRISLRILFALF